MNKIKEFTNNERVKYGELYYKALDLVYDQKEILGEKINKRPYVKKIEVIKSYLDKLDDADYKADKKGIIDILRSDEIYKKEVLDYKKSIIGDIEGLERCVECKCIKCIWSCTKKSCFNCGRDKVEACNKKDTTIYKSENTVELYHHEENRNIEFLIIGRMEFKEKEYMLLKDIENHCNTQLYGYSKSSRGEEDFRTLEQEELDEIWDIFVEMGVYE